MQENDRLYNAIVNHVGIAESERSAMYKYLYGYCLGMPFYNAKELVDNIAKSRVNLPTVQSCLDKIKFYGC